MSTNGGRVVAVEHEETIPTMSTTASSDVARCYAEKQYFLIRWLEKMSCNTLTQNVKLNLFL